jgi:hypothetical protein
MPGAPNRPPDTTPAAPLVPPVQEPPEKKVLRRLAPSRVALLWEGWKGAPSLELITPFTKAETAYAAGDFPAAVTALDLLSVRFAEPRWPSLPEPFKRLRVPIPAPMPPHWNPDNALAPTDREAKRARDAAAEQLALAEGCLAWLTTHGTDVADLRPKLEEAKTIFPSEGASAGFYERIDSIWETIRTRAPLPKGPAVKAAPASAAADAEAGTA